MYDENFIININQLQQGIFLSFKNVLHISEKDILSVKQSYAGHTQCILVITGLHPTGFNPWNWTHTGLHPTGLYPRNWTHGIATTWDWTHGTAHTRDCTHTGLHPNGIASAQDWTHGIAPTWNWTQMGLNPKWIEPKWNWTHTELNLHWIEP